MSNITVVERNVSLIAAVLSRHSPNNKERSEACVALGRLAVWAEAGMVGRATIELKEPVK